MAGVLLIGAEDVILVPSAAKVYEAPRPIREGIELVRQLQNFPTSRCAVIVGATGTEGAEHWCKMNGLPQVSVVPIAVEDADLKLETRTHQAVLLYGRRGGLEDIPKPESWDTLQERSRQRREAIAEAS
jgi:hypothetical protein